MFNILISIMLIDVEAQLCNLFPFNPSACVQITDLQCILCFIQGHYNYYTNSCEITTSQILGCEPNLNQKACVAQLSKNQSPCYCNFDNYLGIFDGRCKDAQEYHYKSYGCSKQFSYHACLAQQDNLCAWVNGSCQNHILEKECNQLFEVSFQVCSRIETTMCYNTGADGNYQCKEQFNLNKVFCQENGLNKKGCMSIKTNNQFCVFSTKCDNLKNFENATCDMNLNQHACLRITNQSQKCQWIQNQCVHIQVTQECNYYQLVNQNVCSNVQGECYYNNGNCQVPQDNFDYCSVSGLSKSSCFKINSICQFNGKCLVAQPLNILRCDSGLNKLACLSLQTTNQYCQWDYNNNLCISIKISQSTKCNLEEVNGNLCQAIFSEPCKYNSQQHKCEQSEKNDLCSTPYLNLIGCVAITKLSQYCQWNQGYCTNIIITKYLTKCSQLTFANPNSCQQVYNQDINEQNCYFNEKKQGCSSFINKSIDLTCQTPGLNEVGCTNIRTKGSVCRFSRGECIQIIDTAQIQSVPCIDVRSVNPISCSLVLFNGQNCKYNQDSRSCVTSVDLYKDNCETEGLNNYGCAALMSVSCYYDTENQICKELPKDNQLADVLSKLDCVQSFPSRLACLQITKPNQLCNWIRYKFQCKDLQVVPWNFCKDYIQVNPNVCASVNVQNPNPNNRGYCIFDNTNFECTTTDQACPTPCCETLSGINAHVCSRYSSKDHYCYFGSDLRCHEMILENDSDTYASQFITDNQIKCESLNYKSCKLSIWSKQQLCLQQLDDRCQNVDFQYLDDYSPFFSPDGRFSKYTCIATQKAGIQILSNKDVYFRFDPMDKKCISVQIDEQFACHTLDININICTRLTTGYCKWDVQNLQCIDLMNPSSCDGSFNQNACNNQQNPCIFNLNSNRCSKQYSPISSNGCSYYSKSNNLTVSMLTCTLVNKVGESCLYNLSTNECFKSQRQSSLCNVPGSNKFYCYSQTQQFCIWNDIQNICQEVPLVPDPSLSYGCSQNVNKMLCLSIKSQACAWDTINLQCIDVLYNVNLSCNSLQDPNYLYNILSCTQVTLSGSYCHWDNYRCLTTNSFVQSCTQPPMNINSCKFLTRTSLCYFVDKCTEYTGSLDIQCEQPGIGVQICSQITKQPCKYQNQLQSCIQINVQSSKCSDLIDGNYYNRLSCISISQNVNLNYSNNYSVCGIEYCGYEKYCFWDPNTFTCNTATLAYSIMTYSPTVTITYDPTDTQKTKPIETINVIETCNTYYNVFNFCDNNLSKAICLELVQNTCYFDLSQGGCLQLIGHENNLVSCEQANCFACSKITTPGLLCMSSIRPPDGCMNKFQQQSCSSLSIQYGVEDCSNYSSDLIQVNSLVCSNLIGSCYWNGNQCGTFLDAYCDLAGLSIDSCTQLGCEIGPPCSSTTEQEITSCESIPGSLSVLQQQDICIKIQIIEDEDNNISNSCGWDPIHNLCFTFEKEYECQELTEFVQGPQACIQYSTKGHQGCEWRENQCLLLFQTVYYCTNLNQYACLQLTEGISCIWVNNSCQQETSDVISTYTDCEIANKIACKYINSNCWIQNDLCTQSIKDTTCSNVKKFSGNISACVAVSRAGQFCLWNQIKDYCDDSQSQNLTCDTPGLNNLSCFKNTQGLCIFTTKCETATSTTYSCLNSSKNLCLINSLFPCYWSNQNTCNQVAFKSDAICSDFYSVGSDFVNPLTCAMISKPKQACAYLQSSDKQSCQPIYGGDCNTLGINQLGCLTVTNLPCQFDLSQYKCFQVQDYDQDCNMGFNNLACIKLTKQVCYYNQQCLEYNFNLVNSINVIQLTSQYQYNYRVCQQIDIPNAYLYYDPNTYKCVQYNGDSTLKCSQKGLNLQGCLYKTQQDCMFENGECQIVQYANLAIYDCQSFKLNFVSCMHINQYTCKFLDSQCQPTLVSDDCHSLSNQIVNPLSCSTQTSEACSYDINNHNCIVQTSTDIECNTPGLNKLGCLQNTINQRCIFENNMCTEGIKTNYICDDPINQKNCALVSLAGQYCIFDEKCQQQSQNQLEICLKLFKNNPQSCLKAIDQPCSYDQLNYTCKIATGVEDCLTDHTLNEIACKQNKGPSICYWNGQACVGDNIQLNSKLCSDSINLQFCTQITTTNQFCQFTNQCQNLDQMNHNSLCSQLTNINRYEFCEYTLDVPCMYDRNTHSCYELTPIDQVSQCQRGLNKLACLNNVKESCLFQQFCYSSQQISICEQAQSLLICLGLTSLLCAWKDNLCQTFDPTNIPCAYITFNVVPIVCYQSKQIPPFVCAYDKVQQNCYELQPLSCSDINERNSCQLFSTQPCLWVNNQCQFTQFLVGGSSCSDVGSIGTDRACRDINKYGQYCKYYSKTSTCGFIDEFISCNDPVNYNTCITQTVKQCQWIIQSTIIQSNQYQYGNCKQITDLTTLGCSQNLSFLACVGISQINQFCYFHDKQCLKLQIPKQLDLYDLTMINQNICSLVTTVPAQYDKILFTCQPLQDFSCNTKGINRLGCVSIQTERCRWDENTFQCHIDIIDSNKSCIDQNVSQQICQQCQGLPVQFQEGNCIQINPNSKCSDPGINKAGCLKTIMQPCRWIDNACKYYYPLGQCEQANVNQMVCALNAFENCKFDGINKCILANQNENCETIGLNLLRCVQLKGCIFDQGCQNYDKQNLKCLEIGQASPDVCALAMDSCKYDPITFSCIKPTINDPCNTVGFSQFACLSQFDCQFSNQKCECSLLKERYPECSLIKSEDQCELQTHCFSEQVKYENGYLQQCRDFTCSDFPRCQGSFLYGLPCYLDKDSNCQLAQNCNTINSNNCDIVISGQQCIFENNKCTDLICETLSEACPQEYCKLLSGKCITLSCDLLLEIPCTNRQNCYWNGRQCYKQGSCKSNDSVQCQFAKEQNKQCGWVDKQQLCTDSPCRYMGSNKNDCLGIQTEMQTCVILANQSCVACEEITDTCICLQNKGYCDLQQNTNKCISLRCNSYQLFNCPTTCRIANDLCVPQCNKLSNSLLCFQGSECLWNNQLNKCYQQVRPVQKVEQILPEYNQYGLIVQIFPVIYELFI